MLVVDAVVLCVGAVMLVLVFARTEVVVLVLLLLLALVLALVLVPVVRVASTKCCPVSSFCVAAGASAAGVASVALLFTA